MLPARVQQRAPHGRPPASGDGIQCGISGVIPGVPKPCASHELVTDGYGRSISAHLWALRKAGVRQPILILSPFATPPPPGIDLVRKIFFQNFAFFT